MDGTHYSTITAEHAGKVARITLNRPEVHNAFTAAMIRELREAVRAAADDPPTASSPKIDRRAWVLAAAALTVAFAWAYWPTFLELVAAWERSPDYSHGYLVVPLALFFLWVRRDEYPGVSAPRGWPGVVQLGLAAN